MDNHEEVPVLYMKRNKRYYKIPPSIARLYSGHYPKPGIWSIKPTEATWVGDHPTPIRINMQSYKDVIVEAVVLALDDATGKMISRSEMALLIVDAISKKLEDGEIK